jgi:hypothetical protein
MAGRGKRGVFAFHTGSQILNFNLPIPGLLYISATCVLYNFVETAGRGKGEGHKKILQDYRKGPVAKCPPQRTGSGEICLGAKTFALQG